MGTGVVEGRFCLPAGRSLARTSIFTPPFKNYYILHPPYHTTSSTSTPSIPHTAPPVAPHLVGAVGCTRDGGHSTTYGNICKSVQVSASAPPQEGTVPYSPMCAAPPVALHSVLPLGSAPCGVYRHQLRTFQAHYGVTSCAPCAPARAAASCTVLVRSLQSPLLQFVTHCSTDTACTPCMPCL